MKTINRTTLFLCLVAGMLLLTGILTWLGFHNGFEVVVDGETVTGVPAAFFAFGGTLAGILIAVLALVFAGLVLTGVSLLIVVLLAVIFAGVVILLSPLTIPLLIIVGLYLLFRRKKGHNAVPPALPGSSGQVG